MANQWKGAKRALFIYCCGAAAPQQQLKAGQRGEEIHPSNNTPQHDTKITHTTTITITLTTTHLFYDSDKVAIATMEPFDIANT